VIRQRVDFADLSYVPAGPRDPILSPKQGLLLGELSRREIARFDIVGFSVSYENDFVNIPDLIMKAGLSPLAEERSECFPLLISGGFTMSTNPLPIADFVDVVVVGEIEAVADALIEAIREAKAERSSKARLLRRLATLPGIYVPALGQRPVKRIWADTDGIAPEPGVVTGSHFGDMLLVEVGRGCGRGCNFCAAGNLYRPVRMRSGETILALAGGAASVGLVGTAVGDHPDLETLLRHLTEQGKRIGISSMRPDQVTLKVAALLVRGGARTIAIAPEAGTDALRARIGKSITDEEIERAVGILSRAGISSIKLYFMIGLPGETDGDVEAIIDLVARLAGVRGKARLSVAAGPFVPKPHTVFQWAPFADRDTLKARMGILKRVRRIKGCTLKVQPVDEAWVEAVLARGERPLSGAILEAAHKPVSLKRLLLRGGFADPAIELDTEKPLPWDFIETGVDKEGLKRKYLALRSH
jgi:radical SAM superfamily enzyme YgiQ (UPF0313 family)